MGRIWHHTGAFIGEQKRKAPEGLSFCSLRPKPEISASSPGGVEARWEAEPPYDRARDRGGYFVRMGHGKDGFSAFAMAYTVSDIL